MMQTGWNPKPGSLKFGIDNILQTAVHQGKASGKIPMTFRTAGRNIETSDSSANCSGTIDHFYGRSLSLPTQQQQFAPLSSGFGNVWNCPPYLYGGTHTGHYRGHADYSQDIPNIVQRVPLAISYRKTDLLNDISKTCHPPNNAVRQGKRKKTWTRAVFSSLQRKGLERSFFAQQYISKKDRRKLAATLGLTDSQVRIWYANRRMKNKKSSKHDGPAS